jgi:hypothetical protein
MGVSTTPSSTAVMMQEMTEWVHHT